MTGEGTISEVAGVEAAAGWFTTALIVACERSVVREKDLAVSGPVAKAPVIPPITAAQRSTRCRWTLGAFKLSVFMAHSISGGTDWTLVRPPGVARVISSTPKTWNRHAHEIFLAAIPSKLIILFDYRAKIRET
jgi:hypothetical protein